MRFQFSHVLAALALPLASTALPANAAEERDVPSHMRGKRSSYEENGVKRSVFEHEATGATLDFVTNSGICETTPGVNQYSGYITTGILSTSQISIASTFELIFGFVSSKKLSWAAAQVA
ncbi:hypothetical protein LSUE1_G003004 [Lachnellula suecica]|uniref:Uncharacterized protein n=1 Tax=Lachnellula suecica TaxID=602035 RepID=A0A8T9CA01_9HELO|nr:hypothetical protein LSUE1_G003004 [Lachnellula suecica]